MSTRRWGTACRISRAGFAVPMSMSRYTIPESTLMISTGRRRASRMARDDLPLAVGPMRKITGGSVLCSILSQQPHERGFIEGAPDARDVRPRAIEPGLERTEEPPQPGKVRAGAGTRGHVGGQEIRDRRSAIFRLRQRGENIARQRHGIRFLE